MKLSKIMIIEDDPVIQGELQTLLNGNGYTTLGVRNFSAVTEQIQDEKPHLILLDIKLPGENGFALCSKIRTFSEVPIIFVTSCNTDMDELNSIMLGGDAFITKPYNTAILLAKIASLLKKTYPAQQREKIVYGDAVLHLECGVYHTGRDSASLASGTEQPICDDPISASLQNGRNAGTASWAFLSRRS